MAKPAAPIAYSIFTQSGEFSALAAFGRCANSEDVARGEEYWAALQSLIESQPKVYRQSQHRGNGPLLLCGKFSATKV